MEKTSLKHLKDDLKCRRDALSLSHEDMKKESDAWGMRIMVLSLASGSLETAKLQMGWDSDIVMLIPIIISSIIGALSAYVRFRDFATKMEILVKAQGELTNTLTKLRDADHLSPSLKALYNKSLEHLDTSLYPDVKASYIKKSNKNLIGVAQEEARYMDKLFKLNAKRRKALALNPEEVDDDISDTESVSSRASRNSQSLPRNFERNFETLHRRVASEIPTIREERTDEEIQSFSDMEIDVRVDKIPL
jgi:hypothetical protein